MRLDLFRKFSRDFRREFLHDFFVFAKVARWVLHQRDWGAANVGQRNIEQQKLFREDSSKVHFGWLRNLELAVLALARIMCADIHSQNGTAILAQVVSDPN